MKVIYKAPGCAPEPESMGFLLDGLRKASKEDGT